MAPRQATAIQDFLHQILPQELLRQKAREFGFIQRFSGFDPVPFLAALCALLPRVGQHLPPSPRDAIIARGAEAVEPLLAIALDRGSWWRRENFYQASRHALMLLIEVNDERAVEPVLALTIELWEQEEPPWLIADSAIQALEGMGGAALEPILRELERGTTPETREALIGSLSRLRVQDDRIWVLLLEQLERAPDYAAGNLADYGAEAALPQAPPCPRPPSRS